jgi:hypothetical protein
MHRYADPWAWGRAAGIVWSEESAGDPDPTKAEIAELMGRYPGTIAIIRYDPDRPALNLAAHCAIAVADVLTIDSWEIPLHVALPFRAIAEASDERVFSQGDAIDSFPCPVWDRRLYHAWRIRLTEMRHGIPRESLAKVPPGLRGRLHLARWIVSLQRAHSIQRAR